MFKIKSPFAIVEQFNDAVAKGVSIVFKGRIGVVVHYFIFNILFTNILYYAGKKLNEFQINVVFKNIHVDPAVEAQLKARLEANFFDPVFWSNPYILLYVTPFIVLYLICFLSPFLLAGKASRIYCK